MVEFTRNVEVVSEFSDGGIEFNDTLFLRDEFAVSPFREFKFNGGSVVVSPRPKTSRRPILFLEVFLCGSTPCLSTSSSSAAAATATRLRRENRAPT